MTIDNAVLIDERNTAEKLMHTKVSHIGLRVRNIAAAVVFYERVLGLVTHETLADGGVRLGWGIGHHVIDLIPGENGLDHFGFEVRDDGGLNRIRENLQAANYTVSPLSETYMDCAQANREGFSVKDHDGNTVHFHSAVDRQGEHQADTGRRPSCFQHITIGTNDVVSLADFYVNAVGFKLSDQLSDGNFAWLRGDRDHHVLAMVNVGKQAVLDHYSYDLATWDDFKHWCDRLTDLNVDVQWGPGRHGPGNNLFVFFDDSAGNHIELSAEMENFHDDRVSYAPRIWEPVPRSVNLWGGQLANWRHTTQQ